MAAQLPVIFAFCSPCGKLRGACLSECRSQDQLRKLRRFSLAAIRQVMAPIAAHAAPASRLGHRATTVGRDPEAMARPPARPQARIGRAPGAISAHDNPIGTLPSRSITI